MACINGLAVSLEHRGMLCVATWGRLLAGRKTMDLGLFEKSSDIAPALVRLYDSHRLYGLAKDSSPLARAELTGAVVDILGRDLAPRERELVSDVMISLLRQAEKDLRAAISERLAVLPESPLRVILHIANDDISVAEPVLKSSMVLSDLDLLYIIKSKTPEYWQAIAMRPVLSDGVINVLADTKETGTVTALSENQNIRLTRHAFEVISGIGRESDDVARPLLMRPDVPEDLARKMYGYVGAELKTYLRDYYNIIDEDMITAIDDVVFELSDPGKHKDYMPTVHMTAMANQYAAAGRLTLGAMIEILQRGQYASFIAMFSRYTGFSVMDVHDMMKDPMGKILAITCKAFSLTKGDLSRIYMMTQGMRSEDRIVDQAELLHVLSIYDRVEMQVARRALGIRDKALN